MNKRKKRVKRSSASAYLKLNEKRVGVDVVGSTTTN